jgi:hypothetical protein
LRDWSRQQQLQPPERGGEVGLVEFIDTAFSIQGATKT